MSRGARGGWGTSASPSMHATAAVMRHVMNRPKPRRTQWRVGHLCIAQHARHSRGHEASDEEARAQRRGHRQTQVLVAPARRHRRQLREQVGRAAGE